MSRLLVTNFVSIDGVIQSPLSREDDPDGGFPHGGWVAPYRLLLFPVVLGAGKRTFGARSPLTRFTLTDTGSSPAGVVFLTYTRAAPSFKI